MRYGDARAFRQALEQRLKTRAGGDGARLSRDRKRVAFDRLLARLNATAPERWLLKGGFALDLRLADRARATKDIDLDWQAAEDELLDALIDAAAYDVGDFVSFVVERSGTPRDRLGGSHRFRVAATFARRDTHPVPDRLPPPPEAWRAPFRQLAEAVGVPTELAAAHADAVALLDPILSGDVRQGTWEPDTRRWGDEG